MDYNRSVRKLDLRNQQLTKIPNEVFKLKNLRKLDLRNNRLNILPIELTKLTRLEVLDLSYNNIERLFAGLFKLKNLKILILSYNKLKSLPKQIGQLLNLKILIVAGNDISKFPDEISQLTNLQQLDIAKNKFAKFPEGIFRLPNLESLWINNNPFRDFPINELVLNLPNLKALYCFGLPGVQQTESNKYYFSLSKVRGNCLSSLKTLKKGNHSLNSGKSRKIGFKSTQKSRRLQNKTNIFISYSHKDKDWLERVKIHLQVLDFENDKLEVWDDTRIKSGSKWKEEIKNSLDKCKIAILLISTDFLVSDFIRNDELPTLLKNSEIKGTKILPLIIHPSRFLKNKHLSVFQAVNDPQKPLSKLSIPEQEDAMVKLTDDVEAYLD